MGDGMRMVIGGKPKRTSPACTNTTTTDAVAVDEEYETPPSSSSAAFPIITCPCCGLHIKFSNHHQGFPAGVKFDPTDQQLLQHLEAKVHHKLHTLIHNFIPTVNQAIHNIHPRNLPGVSEHGKISHFFHRTSKPDTSGDGKRPKVDNEMNEDRWRDIGEARPIFIGDKLKGFKKMLVLYSNDGKQKKLEKTNWVRYQYHLIGSSIEEDGKLVVSKVFYVQTQPM